MQLNLHGRRKKYVLKKKELIVNIFGFFHTQGLITGMEILFKQLWKENHMLV